MKELYLKYKEQINYLFFGGLSFVLNIILYYVLLKYLHIDVLIINIIDWVIIVAFCFITNKLWVFENKSTDSILLQLIKFYAGRLFTLFLEEIILYVFITILCINQLIVKVLGQVVVIVVNYLISKYFTFKDKE